MVGYFPSYLDYAAQGVRGKEKGEKEKDKGDANPMDVCTVLYFYI